ncbi:hypothetical protein AWC38_SpisGene18636 [Stylophora pistillata]|uniref:Uncharacterized protein n=1 Tax=Stylophora pistillata TaxID=50429 RepID=A0A2B4RLE1_STYPI|nr:hypothetical protein AWC38_SpisGene18636 [Stylophora pistillata]
MDDRSCPIGQDLMTVSSSTKGINAFDPKPAISNWFLGSKRKRHFVLVSSGQLSVTAKGTNRTASGTRLEPEEDEILPPLPQISEDESDVE